MEVLKLKSTGPNVKAWQTFLQSQGHGVSPDGDFGPKTLIATKNFQTKHGLTADGIVGAKTVAAAVKAGFKGCEAKADVLAKKPVSQPADSHSGIFKAGDELDKKNLAMLSRLHPVLQNRIAAFLEEAKKDGWRLQIVQGLRTFAEQDALYAKGRTKPGAKVTNAKGGQSNHNYGLSVDLAPIVEGKISWNEQHFRLFGKWAKSCRLSWGGDWKSFKDLPHIELPGLPKHTTLLSWYRQGGLAAVWENVD